MMYQAVDQMVGTLAALQSEAKRLHGGEIDVLAQLVERYQHRLYRYLLRMVCQPSTAEDLFQQTWLRVMERIRCYDPQRSFEGWLFAVAHNLAVDHLRRRRPESLDELLPSGETQASLRQSVDPGALDQIISKERASHVADAVSELPLLFREVITLRFEEEMKLEEIATVLGVPMGTVKTRLHRAMKALRSIMGEKSGGGDAI